MENKIKSKILDFNFIDCLYFFTKYDCRNNYKNVVFGSDYRIISIIYKSLIIYINIFIWNLSLYIKNFLLNNGLNSDL